MLVFSFIFYSDILTRAAIGVFVDIYNFLFFKMKAI